MDNIGNGENLVKITDANFEELIKSDKPVLVDFYADWCGPCRMLAPHISRLADEFKGRATVGKLDTDANPDAAERYGIMSIPTVMVFKNGEKIGKSVGLIRYDALKETLEKAIGEEKKDK
jgi:thioredoxin 1